jgi:hypothetical protein
MIVGFHNLFETLRRYKNELFSPEGGLSILMIDALLLIPVMMSAFFYPIVALEVIAAIAALSVLGMVLMRAYHRGQPHRRRVK